MSKNLNLLQNKLQIIASLILILACTSIYGQINFSSIGNTTEAKIPNDFITGSHTHLIDISSKKENILNEMLKSFMTASLSLDPSNATGAGGVDINTVSCSSGYEILEVTNTGVSAQLNSTDGVQSMTITLTNPQDIGQESLSLAGIFAGVTVSGNGTTQLILSNDGTTDAAGMGNALNDLFYRDDAVNPNTAITRELEIFFTSYTGEVSNTATAFFDVTRGSQSGTTGGATIVFNVDPPLDLFSTLDGSEDPGGSWIDVDGTGALAGSNVLPTLLPLGGSTFRYQVSADAPCPLATTTVIIINLNASEVPISAPSACGSFITNYTSPIFSSNSNDPIYTFDTGSSSGELMCETGVIGTTYTWYKYDPLNNSYFSYPGNSTALQTGLDDGGYLVVRNELGIIEEGRAWVWNTSTIPNAGVDQTICTGTDITIDGATTIVNPTFTYYDPVERPFIIDASTSISISFDALHTWVSDLGFYAINPDGMETIALGVNQGNICNSGDNVSGLTFTNNPLDGTFNFCGASVPLSGSHSSYFDGTNTIGIDWSGWIGEDARSSGWKVQIYDCVNQDFGSLTGATLIFDDNAGNVVTYTSGSILVAINDDSCNPVEASIYEVPGNPAIPNTESVFINDGVGVGGNGGYEWSYSVDGATGPWSGSFENATLNPIVTINEEIWFRLQIDNSTPCISEDIVHYSVVNQAYAGYGFDSTITELAGVFDLYSLLVDEQSGGTWTVSSGSPGSAFNASAGTFDASAASAGSYTFSYSVNPSAPCIDIDQTDVVLTLSIADFDNDGTPDSSDPAPNDPCDPNPLAIGSGDCDGDGTINSAEASAAAALDPCDPLTASNDTDGDMICNLVDLDDDNDGIPDAEENQTVCDATTTSTFNYIDFWSAGDDPILTPPSTPLIFDGITLDLEREDPDGILILAPEPGNVTQIRPLFNNLENVYVVKQNSTNAALGNVTTHTWEWSEPIANLDFEVFDIDDAGGWKDNIVIRGFDGATEYSIIASDVTLGATVDFIGSNTFIGTANVNTYPQSSARVVFPVPVDRIVVEFSNLDATGFATQLVGFKWGVSWCPIGDNDFDGDGIDNALDLDSDNDGIPDIIEAGGVDTDGDGMVDSFSDGNDDGLHDPLVGSPLPVANTDGTGNENYLDIDSDDDGIVDNIEFQSTAGYVAPGGSSTNGWNDTYQGSEIDLANTDGEDDPDYLDDDSDNDGQPDIEEGWDTDNDGTADTLPSGDDDDNDGLDDAFDNDITLVNPTNGQVPTDFPNLEDPGTTELDWREEMPVFPPVADNDVAEMDEDDPAITIDVLDGDVAGTFPIDPGSVNVTSGPSNGMVSVNADGSIDYTPNANFNGTDTFTYEVCDNQSPANCDEATVTVTVNPVNDHPTAEDNNATVPENGQVIIPVLGNDNDNLDPLGNIDPATVTIITQPTNGTVTVNSDGTITYEPDEDYDGPDSFVYEVCDDGNPLPALCDEATVNIDVTNVNQSPIAIDDTDGTSEGTPVATDVVNNDNDPDGTLNLGSITIITPPTNGSVVVNGDGTITYTPDPGFAGDDSYVYEICDDGTPVLCDTATVTITVSAGAPIATDDTETVDEDGSVTIDILGNDTDPDGAIDPTSVTITVDPPNGTVTVNPDGTVTYVPDPNFNGTDTFTYQVCDDGAPTLCDEATVTVTVNPVNDAPIIVDDNVTTDEDIPVTVSVLASDSDLLDPLGNIDPTTLIITGNPANGTVVINPDGTITYTPNPGFNGTDSFTYEVCDDGNPLPALCGEAAVNIIIDGINDGPNVVDDTDATSIDIPVTTSVLDNDTDSDGIIDPTTVTIITPPMNGTVVINPDGTITYTPNPGFFGDDSYVYEVCDDGTPVLCDTAIVFITILECDITDVALDCDNDGATNGDEIAAGTDPSNPDTDGDGILDGDENDLVEALDPCSDPAIAGWMEQDTNDCDGDGLTVGDGDTDDNNACIPDVLAIPTGDCDNDGATNEDEDAAGTDPNNPDTDGDGILDGDENDLTEALDPCSDPTIAGWMEQDSNDCDNDGLTVGDGDSDDLDACVPDPLAVGTGDCDNDGTLNEDETDATAALDPCDPSPIAVPTGDCDNDGATNEDEVDAGTDPTNPDTDGDGILDGDENDLTEALDPCSDPTIAGWMEQDSNDCDNDGIIVGDGDSNDFDACIPDPLAVGTGDCDNDGTLNEDETDATAALDPCDPSPLAIPSGDCDNDGATNGDEDAAGTDPTNPDTDGDGILDGDENDLTEALDPCSDPTIAGWMEQNSNDCDGDGVLVGEGDPDDFDVCIPDISFCIDSDGDGLFNVDDLDDDNDGISDADEGTADTDNDGIIDSLDLDSDNDGIPDIIEAGGVDENNDGLVDEINIDGTLVNDADGDGWADNEQITPFDTDGDGLDDFQELDSDNDGIPDIIEGGGIDSDGNGTVDEVNDDGTLTNDSNADGWADNEQLDPEDSDGDGLDNYIDLDSDNDGIPDIIESGNTDPDNDGMVEVNEDNTLVNDADGNGWTDDGVIDPVDTDGDGTDDYIDTDSDGDGLTDIFENGNGNQDNDGDGMIDEGLFIDLDGNGWDDDSNDPLVDTDNDGNPNYTDLDSDGDGIIDGIGQDLDGLEDCDDDNTIDYLDPDPCELDIPDAFSPNDDNMNDVFVIKGLEAFPNNELIIFNRWGNKVFEAKPYNNDWNGDNDFGIILGEKQLPDGTYFYVLELGNGDDPIKGYIYLKR